MKLNTKLRGALIALVGVFVLAVAGMIVSAHSENGTTDQHDELEQTLARMESMGLNTVGVSMREVFGNEYPQAVAVCPGETEREVEEQYGVDASDLHLGDHEVPENTNYLLLGKAPKGQRFVQFSRDHVDFCAQKPRPFRTQVPSLFVHDSGTWYFVR